MNHDACTKQLGELDLRLAAPKRERDELAAYAQTIRAAAADVMALLPPGPARDALRLALAGEVLR